jgi:hypothetical protein
MGYPYGRSLFGRRDLIYKISPILQVFFLHAWPAGYSRLLYRLKTGMDFQISHTIGKIGLSLPGGDALKNASCEGPILPKSNLCLAYCPYCRAYRCRLRQRIIRLVSRMKIFAK